MAYLNIKNLNFSYGNRIAIDDISLDIDSISNIAICGPSGSGKSTLIKLLTANKFGTGSIIFNGHDVKIDNLVPIKKNIGAVFNDGIFIYDIVLEELQANLNNLMLSSRDVTERLKEIVEFFDLHEILKEKIENLRYSDKMLIKILSVLITYPDVICIDEVFEYLVDSDKEKLMEYLKNNRIKTIITFSDLEFCTYCEYLVVLLDGKIVDIGTTLNVLKNEKLIKRLGLNLPFYVDLSTQLCYYDLIDKVVFNKEDLTKLLWK